jgi:hypothetical protein
MKKILTLVLGLAFGNAIVAQQSITITGSAVVEVGVPYTYAFTFNPVYPPDPYGVIADGYNIYDWIAITSYNGAAASVPGYIYTPSNSDGYWNGTWTGGNGPNPIQVPIQWGDGSDSTTDMITAKMNGSYTLSNPPETFGYFNYLEGSKSITIQRMTAPVISGPSPVTNCDQTNQTYTFTNSTNSNLRVWTVSAGATIIGSNTGTSVTVKPPLQGNYTVTCSIRRSTASANYVKVGSKTVTRKIFTTASQISGPGTVCTSGAYSITGLEAGLSLSSWSISNSTVATLSSTTTPTTTVTQASSEATVILTANIKNTCNEIVSITKSIVIGTPEPLIVGTYCPTESAPCSITATPNNGYLIFTLTAAYGTYIPLDTDWQWEKISGNFWFLDNGFYNSPTHTGITGNIYINGANPNDNPAKFRVRFHNSCGWSAWREYHWGDGTTTPPPPPPTAYYKFTPIPAPTYSAASLIDPNVYPPGNNFPMVLYNSAGGQVEASTIVNNAGSFYFGNLAAGSYNAVITCGSHVESHTIVKL